MRAGRIMFGIFRNFVLATMVILVFVGCGVSSSVNGGFEPVEILVLDDDYESTISLNKGEIFALDILIPFAKGYRVIGASFDPSMLRLEHYLEYDDDGSIRTRYMFLTLAEGVSDGNHPIFNSSFK
jgi:hypothetical protein